MSYAVEYLLSVFKSVKNAKKINRNVGTKKKKILNLCQHLWDEFGTQLQFSCVFHLWTDGQTEVVNHILGNMLKLCLW